MRATNASPSRNAALIFLGIAVVSLLSFLAPNIHKTWDHRGGGLASHTYTYGVPNSPWLEVAWSGNGPMDAVKFGPVEIHFHWAAWSWLFVLSATIGVFGWTKSRVPRFD